MNFKKIICKLLGHDILETQGEFYLGKCIVGKTKPSGHFDIYTCVRCGKWKTDYAMDSIKKLWKTQI